MRATSSRKIAAAMLAAWLLSAFMGQSVWLHVESDHHDHDRAHEHRSLLLVLQDDDHDGHEHPLFRGLSAGPQSQRPNVVAPSLVTVPWRDLEAPALVRQSLTPSYAPRGSPRTHTILLI